MTQAGSSFDENAEFLRWRTYLIRLKGEMTSWGGLAMAGIGGFTILLAIVAPLDRVHLSRVYLYVMPLAMVGVVAGCHLLASRSVGRSRKRAKKRIGGYHERYEWSRPWLPIGLDVETGEEIVVPNRLGVDPDHTLIAGATGIGKTVFMKNWWACAARGTGPCIFVNAKHEDTLVNEVAYVAFQAKRRHEFRIVNVSKPQVSHSFDPLYGLTVTEQDRLIQLLYPLAAPGAQYYHDMVTRFLVPVLQALESTERRYTLREVYGFYDDPTRWVEWMRIHFGHTASVREVVRLLESYQETSKTFQDLRSSLAGMAAKLAPLCTPPMDVLFCPDAPDFTMTEVFRNNLLLYVTMTAGGTEERGRTLGRILLGSIWIALTRLTAEQSSWKVDPPGLVMLDEVIEYMTKNLGEIVSKARASWVRMLLGAQEMYQFVDPTRDGSAGMLEDIETNATVQIVGRQKGRSGEIAAALFGKVKKMEESWRVATASGFGWGAGDGGVMGGGSRRDLRGQDRTIREVEEPALTKEDMATVPNREAYVAIRDRGPLRVRLFGVYGVPRSFLFDRSMLDRYQGVHRRRLMRLDMSDMRSLTPRPPMRFRKSGKGGSGSRGQGQPASHSR